MNKHSLIFYFWYVTDIPSDRVGAFKLRQHTNPDLHGIFLNIFLAGTCIVLVVTPILCLTEIPGHLTLSHLLQGDPIMVGKQK